MKKVIINGKFYTASLEGMPRVGREVVAALDAYLSSRADSGLKVELVIPANAVAPEFRKIRVRRSLASGGVLWEQLIFPLYVRGHFSINFTNTAPLLLRFGLVVVHDAQFRSTPQSQGWKSRLLYNLVTPFVARKYTKIVTVSQYAKQELHDFGVCTRRDVAVIPNGSNHVAKIKEDKSVLIKYGLLAGDYYLSNSYIHKHKNVFVLLRAAKKSPAFARKLILFGSSTRNDYLERGFDVPPEVRFLGRISDVELVTLMRNASLFLFPSKTEGFGLPPLEAMALGCPTICSSGGAMPEVCGNGVVYADPDSSESWLREIENLDGNDLARRELGIAGQARALEFSWEKSAESLISIVREVVG